MAGDKLTKKDFAEEGIFRIGAEYAESLRPAIEAEKEWLEISKKAALELSNIGENAKKATSLKEISELQKQSIKLTQEESVAYEKQQKALLAVEKVKQAKINSEKKELELTAKKNAAQKKSIKLSEKEKFELRALAKGKREAALLSSKLSTEYEKQSLTLTKLRRKYKDVALVEGEASEKARKLQVEILKLDRTLKRVDANVGQFQRSVGNYAKGMAAAGRAARNMASALGLVGGAFLFVQVMRDAIGIVRNFGKANATLSAILQVERKEMQGLTEDSIRLGATTVKTANEVTGLQIAYARLGFEQQQILDLTESTISGSIAMNSQLDNTANIVGAVVNTFDDLSATDAPKIIDILSLSTAKSALNFQKLETGIPIVAGAANAAGVSFTKLISLMGKLSDSGIDVSSSSTAIRNIFIESAAQGLNYEEIIEKIKGSQDKLTASNDEFGKRAAVSASVLANNIDKTKELDEALQNAAGTAERMANKELDTLDGAIKLLRSSWEGYILNLDESSESSTSLKNIVSGLAKNLKEIIANLIFAAKAFVAYKIAVKLARLQTFLINQNLLLTKAYSLAAAKGISKTSLAFAKFNRILKANIIGITVTAIAGLIYIFDKYNKTLAETVDKLNNSTDEFIKQREESYLLGVELTKMANRYDYLKKQSELSAEEQIELNKIINKIAKNVPGTVTEIDKYGDAFDISSGKTREFIKLQREVNELETNVKLKKNKEALEALTMEQENLNKATTEGQGALIKSIGVVENIDGVLNKVTTSYSKLGKATKITTKLTEEQTLKFKKLQQDNEKSIITTKNKIRVLNGETGAKLASQAVAKEVLRLKKEEDARLKKEEAKKNKSKKTSGKDSAEEAVKHAIELQKFKLEQQEKSLEDELKNESLTAAKKILISKDLLRKRNDIARESTRLSLIGVEKGANEEKLILEKFDAKLLQNKKKNENEQLQIVKDALVLKIEAIKEAKRAENNALNEVIKSEQGELIVKNNDPSLSNEEKLQNIQEFEDKKVELKRASAIKQVQIEIDKNNALIQSENLTPEERLATEERITNAELALSNLKTNAVIEDAKREAEAIKELQDFRRDFIAQISNNLAETLNIDADNIENYVKSVIDGFIEGIESVSDVLAGLEAAAGIVKDIGNGIYENNIINIENEIEASDNKYDRLIEGAEGDKAKQDLLEKQKEKNREKLEAKKKKEQIKQAKFEKSLALTKAVIGMALAIINAAQTTPYIPLGLAATIAAGVLGTIQIAAIASTPIPKFKFGHLEGTHEGLAITNDGVQRGNTVQEFWKRGNVIRPIEGKNTLINMQKGDQIIKDKESLHNMMSSDELMNKALRASILSSLQIDYSNLNDTQSKSQFNINYDKSFNGLSDGLRREIRDGFKRMRVTVNNNIGSDIAWEQRRHDRLND